MKKVRFVNSKDDTSWGIQLEDGRIISLVDENGKFYFGFDVPFNFETGEIYDMDNAPADAVTLNNLRGRYTKIQCYDACEYHEPRTYRVKYPVSKAMSISCYFKKHGYTVAVKDIANVINAWNAGGKVGLRNEELGYHLFSPCGGNPLSICLTTLHERCAEWQTTYVC